ncbi:pre-mRNA splicing facgtor ATP-dependent RNA helicase prp22-like protein (nucleomorph) [Chroomonas mesostigmatica CCMP1168]|uniref:Pre-mRNA splicing facgtor ATP-dependent RNA helicase prp22-like protein n=1 Tax=Chroomonas mesostigmatica CCMP1168 TaxID=1195612 RepID=J7G9T5_9CRYP|nr:pre-mRNA splicing facgtor ATP-dependent RNA helicase prp22-like protein [Chroomonas mesostigmatica CCMP1168]
MFYVFFKIKFSNIFFFFQKFFFNKKNFSKKNPFFHFIEQLFFKYTRSSINKALILFKNPTSFFFRNLISFNFNKRLNIFFKKKKFIYLRKNPINSPKKKIKIQLQFYKFSGFLNQKILNIKFKKLKVRKYRSCNKNENKKSFKSFFTFYIFNFTFISILNNINKIIPIIFFQKIIIFSRRRKWTLRSLFRNTYKKVSFFLIFSKKNYLSAKIFFSENLSFFSKKKLYSKYFDQKIKINLTSSLNKEKTQNTISEGEKVELPLPIYFQKKELLRAISLNPILIIIGETGCGKTTQIPKYLYENNLENYICCTQPRRISAISVAKRVAFETKSEIGKQIGYSIRFEDCTSESTRLKYVTDGVLLRELLTKNMVFSYDIVLIDEAHERSMGSDTLVSLMKIYGNSKKKFKLLITSATLDIIKFSSYLQNCPVFSIPGKNFIIDTFFIDILPLNYLEKIVQIVWQIHFFEKKGDILVFLTGQKDIELACELTSIFNFHFLNLFHPLFPLPIYSCLPIKNQKKVFLNFTHFFRKCIFSTNISETSLTLENINFIIDSGFMKQKFSNGKIGNESIFTIPSSRANCRQRTGRTGRTRRGKCFRIFTEKIYTKELTSTPVPEFQRSNFAFLLLAIKILGVEKIFDIDFIDNPPMINIVNSLQSLFGLGYIDKLGFLTNLGKIATLFPIDPCLTRILIKAFESYCEIEMSTIVSILSTKFFISKKEKKQSMVFSKHKTKLSKGDTLVSLCIFKSWEKSKFSEKWCRKNNYIFQTLENVRNIKNQLVDLTKKYCRRKCIKLATHKNFRKALVWGLFLNCAFRLEKNFYFTIFKKKKISIDPHSILYDRFCSWIVYHELINSLIIYIKECTIINPKWLVEIAPRFFSF